MILVRLWIWRSYISKAARPVGTPNPPHQSFWNIFHAQGESLLAGTAAFIFIGRLGAVQRSSSNRSRTNVGPNMTLILSNDDVAKLLTMRECIEVMEEAYVELAEGRGVSRTRSDCFTPTARPDALYSLKSMDGVVPKLGVGAVRINSDIITWPKRGNNMRREKVPAAPNGRYVGLVLLFSVENGEPLAILPDGVMQRMRVGAANGLGIKYLARRNARTVGILGSGWQAGAQLMAACAVRDIETIRCFSPNAQNRETFAAETSALLGVEVIPVSQPEEAIKGADIAMCATNSIDHIFFERWIEPGMHVSSIKRPEIEVNAVKRADRVVIHWNEPSPIHVAAEGVVIEEKVEGRGWQVAEEIDFKTLPTLPELVVGRVGGRKSDDDVTCFINNIGLGYQFAAAGSVVYRKAKASGLGHDLPTDWFTEDVHP
jgi:ornithine cyclodeaminase/alanine dehydrogenase-like protein (mu-crystallin family)